jgi:hypothetical protein
VRLEETFSRRPTLALLPRWCLDLVTVVPVGSQGVPASSLMPSCVRVAPDSMERAETRHLVGPVFRHKARSRFHLEIGQALVGPVPQIHASTNPLIHASSKPLTTMASQDSLLCSGKSAANGSGSTRQNGERSSITA